MRPDDLAARLDLAGDLPHLEEALTHPSYSNEQRRSPRVDNQRLEFLGDAVLGLCTSELLMRRFPEADEGVLSMMRASLVNADALAAWAREVGLGASLLLGRGADAAGEREQTNVLADAVEALVGAVYLDLGVERARRFSETIVDGPLQRLVAAGGLGRDAKSELQERIQGAGGASPRYRVVLTEGPDHQREFVVVVEAQGRTLGEGRGRSKKLAEQAAARAALESQLVPESTRGPLSTRLVPASEPNSGAPGAAEVSSAPASDERPPRSGPSSSGGR